MDEIGTIAAPETAVESTTTETTEAPATETTTESTVPATETTETAGEGDETELPGEPADESIETDGRTLDKQTSENIAALKKLAKASTDPAQQKILAEAAKNLADKHFKFKAYEKEFPTVQDARQAKATLESLGGEEGITELQNEVTDYRNEIEQFSRGDRALLEQLHKANPESTVTMLGHGIDLLTETGNIEGLDKIILKPMWARLQQQGVTGAVLTAANFVKEGKGQEAYDQLGKIGEWLTKVKEMADGAATSKTKAPDPREADLTQREQRLQQQERENTDRSIGEQVTRGNNTVLSKVIDPFFKELKLSNEGRREFTQNLQQKVWAAMKADAAFQRNARAIKAKGDHARTAQFISAKFAELLPGIFRNYKNTLYPNLAKAAANNGKTAAPANGKQPAPKAATQQTGQPVKAAVPGPNEVDWIKTSDLLWAKGQFYKPNDAKLYTYH